MEKRTKTLLLSMLTLCICTALVVGGTFALFSDSVTVNNHLSAGNLDVGLYRTSYKECVLDADGLMAESAEDTERINLVENPNKLFTVSNTVPTSWYQATMEVSNDGSTAFDYGVRILWTDTTDKTAEDYCEKDEIIASQIILSSILSLILCVSVITGATFALFTSQAKTNIAVTSGNVEVIASIDQNKIEVYSPTLINTDGTIEDDTNAASDLMFKNGGSVAYDAANAQLTLTNITPGDKVNFAIDVENKSNVTIQYRVVISNVEGGSLNGLVFNINGKDYTGNEIKEAWTLVGIGAAIDSIPVSIELPATAGDDLRDKTTKLAITVEAVQGNTNTGEEVKEATVATAAQLQEILTAATDAGSGNQTVNISEDIKLAEGETWTPVKIDGYNGAGVVTVNGNGHTISGLDDTLFAGGFAGNSGIIINDLTIANANITSSNDQGYGAFVNCIDSMPKIELNNCHLKDSTITDTLGARVGGLIGWSAGYNNPNDGPVDTYITINNCSVTGCTITAKGSVGAIIGHAGSNPATYHTITNCTVKNNTLTSTDDGGWRVGVVVGTANVGEVTISGTVSEGNTLTQTGKTAPEGQSELYGRFVPGTTGKLTIDNVSVN